MLYVRCYALAGGIITGHSTKAGIEKSRPRIVSCELYMFILATVYTTVS
jgi:hypothetical protein